MPTIRILAEAAAELDAAISHLEREQGVGAAFIDAYERKLRQIARFPASGPLIRNTELRSFLIRRFQYSVVVGTFDGVLIIVAVAHSKQRPGYWRDRI